MPKVKGKKEKNNRNNENTLELTPRILAASGFFGGKQGEVNKKSKCYVGLMEVHVESLKQAEARKKGDAKLNEVTQRAAALGFNVKALGDEIDLRTTRGATDLSALIAQEPEPEPQTAAAPEAEASAAGNLAGVRDATGEIAGKAQLFLAHAKRLNKEQKQKKKKGFGCCGSRA